MLRWHTIFPRFMKKKSRMNVQIVVDFSQLIHQFQWWKWMWWDTYIYVEIRSLLVELKEFSIAHCVQKDFSKNPTSNFTLKGMYVLMKVSDKIVAYMFSRKIIHTKKSQQILQTINFWPLLWNSERFMAKFLLETVQKIMLFSLRFL